MRTSNHLLCILSLFALTVGALSTSWSQLDTVGFPLSIGNKWYYRYVSTPNPGFRVKTITDTLSDGARLVRMTRLGQDSVTLLTETWRVSNGSFTANTEQIYNASLTHDSSWYVVWQNTINEGTILIRRATILGSDSRCQIRSTHAGTFTGGDTWTENRVALGVGWYYHHNHGYYGEGSWNYTYQLIGLRKEGVLYGDTILTSVDDTIGIVPRVFTLHQNYPNPFNPTTTIRFSVGTYGHTSLRVFDLLGREVATLVNEEMQTGSYERVFNAEGLASEVYLYQLRAGGFVQTKKLLLLR